VTDCISRVLEVTAGASNSRNQESSLGTAVESTDRVRSSENRSHTDGAYRPAKGSVRNPGRTVIMQFDHAEESTTEAAKCRKRHHVIHASRAHSDRKSCLHLARTNQRRPTHLRSFGGARNLRRRQSPTRQQIALRCTDAPPARRNRSKLQQTMSREFTRQKLHRVQERAFVELWFGRFGF
jgi:hypothetical protein